MCCVLGAGKSTLLDILSLRKTSGKIAGEVSIFQDPHAGCLKLPA
jgi:ABC-type multidrug transport system ATPase subunit